MRIIAKQYGDFTEITKIQKNAPKVRLHRTRERRTLYGARRPNNIQRTKQICVRRLLTALKEFGCPLLVTLTFEGDADDASYANDSLRRFQMRLRNKFQNAQSLFIPELSPRGRIHFHGLLFNVPLHLGDTSEGRRIISHGEERESRILANLWGAGYVDAKKTDGSPKLAFYISKYITKGGNQIMFNAMRMIRISHGFPKEKVFRGEEAKEIARLYEDKEAIGKWSGDNDYLGSIEKKLYTTEK
jgi:hypothetical protein